MDESKFANGLVRSAPRPRHWMVRASRLQDRAAFGQTNHFSAGNTDRSGPLSAWQLVINTGTTIVTFLMVFLIQNTQTRDTIALQLKLDELIVAAKGARNAIASIEDASDEELNEAKDEIRRRSDTR